MKDHGIGRREFLKRSVMSGAAVWAAGGLAPAARAIEPIRRSGSPRMLLTLAAYSFREFFKTGRAGKKTSGRRIDMFDFVDYCAEQECMGAEVTSYYFPEPLTAGYLLRVKRHAFMRGVELSGTAVGNTFTLPQGEKRDEQIALVKRWIDHALLLGAPHIRVFAGTASGISKEEAKKLCLEALEECADYAGQKGIFLGIENHGGIVSEPDDLIEIVKATKSPWVGVNLDTGNFHTDDPYGDLAKCAPYAVNVQVKVEIRRRGKQTEPTDMGRIVRILRDVNYQGYVALEYEAAEDPWKAVPRHLQSLREAIGA